MMMSFGIYAEIPKANGGIRLRISKPTLTIPGTQTTTYCQAKSWRDRRCFFTLEGRQLVAKNFLLSYPRGM